MQEEKKKIFCLSMVDVVWTDIYDDEESKIKKLFINFILIAMSPIIFLVILFIFPFVFILRIFDRISGLVLNFLIFDLLK